jgi:hypothetical protein
MSIVAPRRDHRIRPVQAFGKHPLEPRSHCSDSTIGEAEPPNFDRAHAQPSDSFHRFGSPQATELFRRQDWRRWMARRPIGYCDQDYRSFCRAKQGEQPAGTEHFVVRVRRDDHDPRRRRRQRLEIDRGEALKAAPSLPRHFGGALTDYLPRG